MIFEDALRLWGATQLTKDYSGLNLEDVNAESVYVEIDVDPGCPDGEDSYYEPAKAVVTVSGILEKSVEVTPARVGRWRRPVGAETVAAGRRVTTVVEYPDMFGIAREANALANGEEV